MSQTESAKYRSQIQRLQNEVNELMKDNKRLSRGLNRKPSLKRADSINSGDIAKYKQKMQQYKDLVHKRDEKIDIIDKGNFFELKFRIFRAKACQRTEKSNYTSFE